MKKPTIKQEQELLDVNNGTKTDVHIPRSKKVFHIGWIKPYTIERISGLVLNEETADYKAKSRYASKVTALSVLNGIKILLFYPIYWRWLYYCKGYQYDQLLPVVELSKKKVPVKAYLMLTILSSQMKITGLTMTKEEAGQFQAELLSASGLPSEKSTGGH